MIRSLIPSLLLVLAPAVPVAAQGLPPDSTIERLIRARVESGRSAGIVVGLLEADGSRRFLAHGDAGEDRSPLGGRSIFEIGSITKVFTGILLADLAARGVVAYDDPVAKHLPVGTQVPSLDAAAITMLHLSTQNSGLPRMPDNFRPSNWGDPFADYGEAQLYAFLAGHELRRAPGEEYEYSNVGVGLLGHALARAAGMSYEAAVRDRILDPLGMDDTAVTLTPEQTARQARGHNALGAEVSDWHLDVLAGAGALRSTAEDMLTFLAANLRPPESAIGRALAAAHEPREIVSPQMRIGLGWHILRTGEGEIVWHNGGTGGFRAFSGFDPTRGTAVVVLANSGGPGNDDLGFHLLHRSVPLDGRD